MPSKNTKKKIQKAKQQANNKPTEKVEIVAEENLQEQVQPSTVSKENKSPVNKEQKVEKTDKKKEKKTKQPSKLKTKAKEVASELKKVTWPTFPQLVKKTATVIAVVIIFAIVLFGIDSLLELLYNWFIGKL